MAFVMYDEVLNKKGKVIGIDGVMVIDDSDKPEKIYSDYVDEYGNKRDRWRSVSAFIEKYGEDLLPTLNRVKDR
jgi:hypothetical protein